MIAFKLSSLHKDTPHFHSFRPNDVGGNIVAHHNYVLWSELKMIEHSFEERLTRLAHDCRGLTRSRLQKRHEGTAVQAYPFRGEPVKPLL